MALTGDKEESGCHLLEEDDTLALEVASEEDEDGSRHNVGTKLGLLGGVVVVSELGLSVLWMEEARGLG